MKKMYIFGILIAIGIAFLGYYLGWLDNGPKPVNVDEIPSRFAE